MRVKISTMIMHNYAMQLVQMRGGLQHKIHLLCNLCKWCPTCANKGWNTVIQYSFVIIYPAYYIILMHDVIANVTEGFSHAHISAICVQHTTLYVACSRKWTWQWLLFSYFYPNWSWLSLYLSYFRPSGHSKGTHHYYSVWTKVRRSHAL